jgi:hypothetical protein
MYLGESCLSCNFNQTIIVTDMDTKPYGYTPLIRRADIDNPKVRCCLVRVFRWCPVWSEFLFYPVFFHSNTICQHYITSLKKVRNRTSVPKGESKVVSSRESAKLSSEQRQRQKDNTKTKNIHKRWLLVDRYETTVSQMQTDVFPWSASFFLCTGFASGYHGGCSP